MHILEVKGLTKYYGRVVGIEDLSCSVEEGEIFGFLGPNGAGKTTTIRLLLQLLQPQRGSISLFGTALKGHTVELRQRLGYLPGEFRPYQRMSGGRFLDYMAWYRVRRPELRNWLLDTLKLTAKDLRQPIKQLSHGNRQKLGIVHALEHAPDLVILDEPTLGLDPLMQDAFYEILRELHRRGKTIFLSSHLLAEVEKVCERVAIIRGGRLVALESLEALKQRRPRRLLLVLDETQLTEPPKLPGARLVRHADGCYEYVLEGDLRRVLAVLASWPVRDLTIPEPKLEDVFLAYYREGDA